MIVDFDDFGDRNHRLDLLWQLKYANPQFRCTLFAVPTWGRKDFWDALPPWVELAVHGWDHGNPPVDGGEARDWTYERMNEVMAMKPDRFSTGFKAPGWQLSTDAMEALRDDDWWLADKDYNDDRRPHGLLTHRDGDGDHAHHHIQNTCGNGLEESFGDLLGRVRAAKTFELVSEVVAPWNPR